MAGTSDAGHDDQVGYHCKRRRAITTHAQTRSDQRQAAFRPAQRRVFRRLCQAGICRARTGDALGGNRRPRNRRHSEPLKIQWPRPVEGQPQEPATLVLRVEGPMALEIQHASDVILERVNRFFGWSAVGRLALRQAPLSRRDRAPPSRAPDAAGGRGSREDAVLGRGRGIAGRAGAARRLDQAKLSRPPGPPAAAGHCHNCGFKLANRPLLEVHRA